MKISTALRILPLTICIFSCAKPGQQNYTASGPFIQQSPSAVISPWLCWITETTINCQATNEIIIRRGQKETKFDRGATISYKNPVGTGKAQIWFGCTGSNSCDGSPIFSSGSVKVESNSSGAIVVQGKEDIIPFGSLGIVETNVENNKFFSIGNRWIGGIAPPILKAGPGTTVSCVDDNCTISVK